MLAGKNVTLRMIQEEDLPEMLHLMNDLQHRGLSGGRAAS